MYQLGKASASLYVAIVFVLGIWDVEIAFWSNT